MKHGHWCKGKPSSTYKSWESMKQRCSNQNVYNYSRYGGRGIIYAPRWESFENFLADMGERPEGTTLDRIDNDGNYEPSNCRWATPRQQVNNRNVTKEYIGVRWEPIRNNWRSRIQINNINYHLGSFDYPWTASYVYQHVFSRLERGESIENIRTWAQEPTSKYKHISIRADTGKWTVRIKGKSLGCFSTEQEAVEARDTYEGGKQ